MSDDIGSFAEHPQSIGEIRAHREHDGSKWSPRDALITALRELDAGTTKPVKCVVTIVEDVGGADRPLFYIASASLSESIGLIEMAKHALMNGCYSG